MPERKPYTFLAVPTNVFGHDYTDSEMEAGIIVNKSVGIRFLREERANLYIMELLSIIDSRVITRFEEPVIFKHSYRYEDPSKLTFLFRTGEKNRGRGLFFQLEAKAKGVTFEKARKLGIHLD